MDLIFHMAQQAEALCVPGADDESAEDAAKRLAQLMAGGTECIMVRGYQTTDADNVDNTRWHAIRVEYIVRVEVRP